MAYEIGLTPDVFYELTPGEFYALINGENRRQKTFMKQLAWQTMHLLNVSGKSYEKPITIEDLLPEAEEQPVIKQKTKEEYEAEQKKLMEEFGEHG